uniref:Putative RNA-dependent RNA polymerase n=1 Tax=Melbourne fly narnavirus 1 TaxID=2250642 RepID=A0A2Z4QL01_9VIRU|nr:putative RNA-dependent RNA polymerase [Melbourne fly narnavirus 1]
MSYAKVCDRVCQHMQSININPIDSSRYASMVSKWLACSGPEWTIERLKSLKQSFMDRLQSETDDYSIPAGWATRKNSKGKVIVKDGLVHRILSSHLSNLKQIEGFLRLYQVIELEHLTKKQKLKMEVAIEAPSKCNSYVESELIRVAKPRNVSSEVLKRITRFDEGSLCLPEMLGSASKRSPVFEFSSSAMRYKRSKSRDNAESADWLEYFQTSESVYKLWSSHNVPVSRALGVSPELLSYRKFTRNSSPVGSVIVLQQHGGKARWIANPLLAFQAIGEPLKNKLFEYSKLAYSREIKTNNQDEGHQTVVDWLKSERKVYSFDATSFTDRFPVSLQLSVLRRLKEVGVVNDFDYDFCEFMVNSEWYCPSLKRNVKWSVGQPLGYGPSFHLATLTHACLVESLARSLKVHDDCWRIVGDDIVIANDSLANLYSKTMTALGVEINKSKSLISHKYAEFLGKLISIDGVNPSIKVKLLTGSDQIVSSLAFYGWSGYKHLSRREKGFAKEAFLPTYLGGTGLRIPGVSNKVWYRITNQDYWAQKAVRSELRSFFGMTSDSLSTGKILSLRSEYYERNGLPLAPVEWSMVTDSPLNAFSNQPISNRSENEDQRDTSYSSSIMNSYAFLIDSFVRSEGLIDTLPVFRSEVGVNRSNPATSILTNDGYVSPTEKEIKLPIGGCITEQENEHADRKSINSSKRPVFERGFNPSNLEGDVFKDPVKWFNVDEVLAKVEEQKEKQLRRNERKRTSGREI